jgi:pimeloyl-ACP methyl ester carboxylesterase
MPDNKKNRKIIFVHGKNTKPIPVEHRRLLLKSLRAGFAGSPFRDDMMAFDEENFELCAWSDLLYSRYEETQILSSAVGQLISSSNESIHRTWLSKLAIYVRRSLYLLVDRCPALMPILPTWHIDFMLEGTRAYLENKNGTAVQIRERLSSLMRTTLVDEGRDVLIIAHSLGSVIAYDLLASQPKWMGSLSVQLLTLGSPLGLGYVQARVLGAMKVFPTAISRWDNISAYGDMVSLDATLQDDFIKMIELGVLETITDITGILARYQDVNGANPHKSYGYLANPTVAALIAAWYLDHESTVDEQ